MALLVAACGDSDDDAESSDAEASTTTAAADSDDDAAGGENELVNACPVDGCTIEFVSATASGDEIEVTWETNFAPDIDLNHIHIYWDVFTAEQVSSDAEAAGVEQGDWVPTDAVPSYVTSDVVSVSERGDSTTLCATAANGEHAVIDPSLVDCIDVSDQL